MANERIERSDAEWQQRLSPEQYGGLPLFGDRTAVHRALVEPQAGRGGTVAPPAASPRSSPATSSIFRAPAGLNTPALRARDRSANTPTTATACTASKSLRALRIAPGHVFPDGRRADRPALLHHSAALDFEAGDAG